MTEHYLCVYPNGELRWIPLDRVVRYDDFYDGEETILLSDLYPVIDCRCCELVRTILPGIVMVVDEEGLISGKQKLNICASMFYAGVRSGAYIFGPAVFFAERMSEYGEPELYPLTHDQEREVEAILSRCLPVKEASND